MFPCLLGCLALSVPRVAIVVVWLLSDYLERAFDTAAWPVLGFLFMPFTLLAYALAWHMGPDGMIGRLGTVLVAIAVLVDLGVIGGSARQRRAKRVAGRG